ncbi:hypothetical protein RvY_11320-1 [Ramazzottius varieornatus]|uniref:Uncharacterized protein n=1 Tax=Ramazzottius varieornatus TaxID=947166 RepID=A0A1D1VL62_RAMVA|nr:hypothetical protein RvY_11320-1 [Ramazzottius varieornatus]
MASDHQEDTRSDETYVRIHGCFSTRHCLQSRTQRRESGGYRRSQAYPCCRRRGDVRHVLRTDGRKESKTSHQDPGSVIALFKQITFSSEEDHNETGN